MIVKKLRSGHWYVCFNADKFFQWPVGRPPRLSDGFGWVDEEDLKRANASMARIERGKDDD